MYPEEVSRLRHRQNVFYCSQSLWLRLPGDWPALKSSLLLELPQEILDGVSTKFFLSLSLTSHSVQYIIMKPLPSTLLFELIYVLHLEVNDEQAVMVLRTAMISISCQA